MQSVSDTDVSLQAMAFEQMSLHAFWTACAALPEPAVALHAKIG